MVRRLFLASVGVWMLVNDATYALTPNEVPSAADAGRIRPEQKLENLERFVPPSSVIPERATPLIQAPAGAEDVHFDLKSVTFEGVKQFDTAKDFKEELAPYIGNTITLKQVYELAALVTRRYRESGYLLSYAYVPDQNIRDGEVTIAVVEGFISDVRIEGDDPNARISNAYIEHLLSERPLRNKTLESILLRLNDLPGRNYRAVLSKEEDLAREEAVLTLIPQAKDSRLNVAYDNYSSRYLGPNEVSATYTDHFLPLQQTTLFGLTSLPVDELNYVLVNHSWVFAADWTLEGTASYTQSEPGYTLTPLNINSETRSAAIGFKYQLIRQRNENLFARFTSEFRNVSSDILGDTTLTRDKIRTVKVALSYDKIDNWEGNNIYNLTFTQGIDGLGGSEQGDENLSRSQARPDFQKLELSVSRIQRLSDAWSLQLQVAGQVASDPLYSSEEFGVGGQLYGRAFDSSEIVGDSGASGTIELRYTGLRILQPINFEPYIFFDGGVVRNRDVGQSEHESLTSAGGGIRFATTQGQAGLVGFAVPLTREVDAPIFGQGRSSPRIILQVSQQF